MPQDYSYTIKFEQARKVAADRNIPQIELALIRACKKPRFSPANSLIAMGVGGSIAVNHFQKALSYREQIETAPQVQQEALLYKQNMNIVEGGAALALAGAFVAANVISVVSKIVDRPRKQEILHMALELKYEQAGYSEMKNITPVDQKREHAFV